MQPTVNNALKYMYTFIHKKYTFIHNKYTFIHNIIHLHSLCTQPLYTNIYTNKTTMQRKTTAYSTVTFRPISRLQTCIHLSTKNMINFWNYNNLYNIISYWHCYDQYINLGYWKNMIFVLKLWYLGCHGNKLDQTINRYDTCTDYITLMA